MKNIKILSAKRFVSLIASTLCFLLPLCIYSQIPTSDSIKLRIEFSSETYTGTYELHEITIRPSADSIRVSVECNLYTDSLSKSVGSSTTQLCYSEYSAPIDRGTLFLLLKVIERDRYVKARYATDVNAFSYQGSYGYLTIHANDSELYSFGAVCRRIGQIQEYNIGYEDKELILINSLLEIDSKTCNRLMEVCTDRF